jgi:rhamnose transport system permease protein
MKSWQALRAWFDRLSETTRRDLAFSVLTVVLFAAVTKAFPGFASPRNVAGLLDDTALLIMLALAQMLVILVRGIDLSIAANLALCGMLAALFNRAWPQAGVLPTLLITLLAGGLLGAINGLLVWKLRLPPIVVTLGTMSIYRGVIFLISKGAWVNENEMSRDLLAFPRAQFLGLTTLTWLALVLVAVFVIVLRRTRLARDLYAAGGNPDAAAFSGIVAGRTQFIAYTVCGAIAGVCGCLWVARFAVAYTDIALGFELSVIAACLIGGVSIGGGIGSAVGVLLGCLFIGIIRSSLPLVGISAFWQMFINGAVILVAVLLSARQRDAPRHILEARPGRDLEARP